MKQEYFINCDILNIFNFITTNTWFIKEVQIFKFFIFKF